MEATQELSQLIQAGERGPYKFLDYFEEKDESTFAGRDRDIKEIAARIMVNRTVVLYGRSGLGKTSLILAGLFPELRRRDLIPVYCRVLQNPRTDVEESLCEALSLAEPALLPEALRQRKVFLVLDQFEEFFVRFDKSPDARQALVDLLKELLGDSKCSLRVLISLREDYLARLDDLKEQVPESFLSDYRLGQLTAFGARQAITRPLIRKDIQYEPKLVSQILEIISSEDFDSLLLQLICTAVASEANRCGRPGNLLAKDLEAVGGLDGILGRYLDAATKEIPDSLRLLTRTLLDALITSENTKRAVTFSVLQQWDIEAKCQELTEALEFLKKKRLVREERRGNNIWYELTHERLVRPILRWFELDRTFAEFRLAREMVVNGSRSEMYRTRAEALLPKETIEGLIRPFRDRLHLDEKQTEFLFWSAVYRRSDEAEFWAKRLQPERCRSILLGLLEREDPVARAGAAHSAFLVSDPAAADLCLKLTIADPDAEVRFEAGQTLARTARAPEISGLKSALSRRATRRKALDALAYFTEGSESFGQFSQYWKWRAGRLARRRRFARAGNVRARHMRVGALTGLISSLIWGFAFLPWILCLALWNTGVAEYFPLLDPFVTSGTPILARGFSIWIVVSLLVGMFVGMLVGRGTARVAVLDKNYGWWRAWLYLFLISGAVITGVIKLLIIGNFDEQLGLVLLTAWVIVFVVSIATIVHVRFGSTGMLDVRSSMFKRWLIGYCHATAPVTIAGTIGLFASTWTGDGGQWFWIGMGSGLLSSLFFYTWTTALVESTIQGAVNLRDRLGLLGSRFSRPFARAAVAALAILYLLIFGPNSIPVFSEIAKFDNGRITVEPHSRSLHLAPNAVFFRVRLPPNSPRIYDVQGVPDNATVKIGHGTGGECFYLPSGEHLGSVSSWQFRGGWTGKQFELSFHSAPNLDGQSVPATDKYQCAVLQLQRAASEKTPVWIGQITGQLTPNRDWVLKILPLIQRSAMVGRLEAHGDGVSIERGGRHLTLSSFPDALHMGLGASVAAGNVAHALSDVPVRYQYQYPGQLFSIRSNEAGNFSVKLKFDFAWEGTPEVERYFGPWSSTYAKKEIDSLPPQLAIAVAVRALRQPDH